MHTYNLPKEYLSASQIKLYQKCGKKYEYIYVLGQRPKNNKININMLQGISIHKTNQMLYEDKIQAKQSLSNRQVAELVVYNFDESEKEAVEQKGLEKVEEKEKDLYYGEIIIPACNYADAVVPHVIPVATEMEFKYESKCGVEILMYIDLIKQLNEEDARSRGIVDYKISAKRWALPQLLGDLQFMIYTKALGIKDIEIHNLVKGSKKSPIKSTYKEEYTEVSDLASNLRCVKTRYPENEYDHLESIIEMTAKGISAGIFMPADPSSWVCTPKFCEYYQECRGAK